MKKYRPKNIKLSLGSNMECDAIISTPGGKIPYLWFGRDPGDGECFGWMDDIRKVRALKRMCEDYLESRGVNDDED